METLGICYTVTWALAVCCATDQVAFLIRQVESKNPQCSLAKFDLKTLNPKVREPLETLAKILYADWPLVQELILSYHNRDLQLMICFPYYGNLKWTPESWNMALGGLVLGSLILYLKGMRRMMFQLSGFYYNLNPLRAQLRLPGWCFRAWRPRCSGRLCPTSCLHCPGPSWVLFVWFRLNQGSIKDFTVECFRVLGFRLPGYKPLNSLALPTHMFPLRGHACWAAGMTVPCILHRSYQNGLYTRVEFCSICLHST